MDGEQRRRIKVYALFFLNRNYKSENKCTPASKTNGFALFCSLFALSLHQRAKISCVPAQK